MTLFWFMLGLALVIGIARYNESNKLFWALFCSLLVGIACGHIVSKCTATESNDDKEYVIKPCPIHGQHCTLDTLSLGNDAAVAPSLGQDHVGKDLTWIDNIQLSFGQDWTSRPIRPPQLNTRRLCTVLISTHLEGEG